MRIFVWLFCVAGMAFGVLAAETTRVNGMVFSAGDGAPVGGAVVKFNLEPPDATVELELRSDAFGGFKAPELAVGIYRLTVEAAGFATHTAEFVAEGEAKNLVVRLNPVQGQQVFDLFAQVNCLATAAPLWGAVLRAEYWTLEDPDGPRAGIFQAVLGTEGNAKLAPLPEGWYRLIVERSGWETINYLPPAGGGFVTRGDKVRLSRSHFASVYMKPVKTDLKVTVRGFDPVRNEPDQLLKGMMIHLTGLSLTDDTKEIVPTISAMTGDEGTYTFRNRAPIRWRVRVARLGYETAEHIFEPRGDGTFAEAIVPVVLGPTKLRVIANSVYRRTQATLGAKIQLEGLADSNTEGISRELLTVAGPAGFETSALFENILPGKYVVRAQHQATINDFPNRSGPIVVFNEFRVSYFPVETFAEPELFQTTEQRIELKPVPARIRGRLFASDELAMEEEILAASTQKPVYSSMAANGVAFVEGKVADMLPAELNRVVVDTDVSGHFTALVTPGMWGVQIPNLAGYTGYSIESGTVSEGFGLFGRGWPYAEIWPFANYDTSRHGPPIGLNSNEETQMNLYAHRKYANLCGFVLNPTADPFRNIVLAAPASDSPVTFNYNHFFDTRAAVHWEGPVSFDAPVLADGSYLAKRVPAGTYTVSLNHPEYTTPNRTVVVAPWNAPGILPPVAPNDASYWTAGIATSKLLLNLQPRWNGEGNIRINRKNYVVPAEGAPYYATIDQVAPEYFSTDLLPGRLFSYVAGGYPSGTWVVYARHGNGWFKWVGTGAPTLDAYEGGPLDNTNAENAPNSGAYTVDLHAYSRADRLFDVPNITVTFSSGEQRVAGGTVSLNGPPQVTAITDPNGRWTLRTTATEIKLIDVVNRVVRVNVFLDRTMTVSGVFASSAGGVVPRVGFSLRDRYGSRVGGSLVTETGTFNAGFLTPQALFLEAQARGFITKRIYLGEPNPDNPDMIGMTVTLDPVPNPIVTDFTMNRFGLFLPGVLRSSDPNGLLNAEHARDTLQVTWKGAGQGQPFRVTLPGFFDANNVRKPDEVFDVQDRVSEMYLVDRRAFEKPFVNDATQERFSQNLPPVPLDYLSATRWLKDVQRAVRDNLPWFVVHQLQVVQPDAGERAEGKLNLWEMPSGVLRPMLVVVTKAGGVAVKDYELPAGDNPSLQGLRPSPITARVLDSIGVLSNLPQFEKSVFESHGNGYVKAGSVGGGIGRPEVRIFRDPIDAPPEGNATLTYKFSVGVNMSLGEGSVGEDAMSYGPSFLGLKPSGVALELEIDGREKKIAFGPVFSAATPGEVEEVNKDYTPVVADNEPLDNGNELNVNAEVSAKLAGVVTLDSNWLGMNRISAIAAQIEAQGKVDIDARYNITKKLPVIGPYLVVADELDIARVYAVFEGTLGAKVAVEIETRIPDTSGTATGSEPERSDLFGTTLNAEMKMFLRLAVGVQLALGGDSVKLTALLQAGAPASAPDVDGIVFDLNPLRTRGYLIEKIEGAVSFVLRGELELWTMKMKKQWQWDREFVIDRASVPRFDLTDMHITQTIVTPGGSMPQRFIGSGQNLVEDFYSKGSVALTEGANPLLVMSGVDAEGRMTVMVSARGENRWNAPVTLGTAGGIVSVSAVELPDGRALIVWSEIAADDVINPYAAMTLRYSISDAPRQNWSAPAALRSENGAIFNLQLAQAGNKTLLLYLAAMEGRDGPATLRGMAFDGAEWSAPADLFGPEGIRSLALDSNAAAIVTRAGALRVFKWDGASWNPGEEIAANATGGVALHVNGDGRIVVAWANSDNQIEAKLRNLADVEWTALGAVGESALGAECALGTIRRGEEDLYLLAWTSGADKNSIFYSAFNATGQIQLPATEVTVRSQGFYDRLRMRSVDANRAGVLAVYTEGEDSTLREFVVGWPAEGDCDGDGIVDATAIAQGLVRDCNNNGIPDFCEIRQGTAQDRNRNGIPDSCEAPVPDDCNLNGISDAYELSLGIGDEDGDGVIDECEALISIRTVPLPTDVRQRYYRAPQLQIRSRTATTLELQFQGPLEQTDDLNQPFRPAD